MLVLSTHFDNGFARIIVNTKPISRSFAMIRLHSTPSLKMKLPHGPEKSAMRLLGPMDKSNEGSLQPKRMTKALRLLDEVDGPLLTPLRGFSSISKPFSRLAASHLRTGLNRSAFWRN